MSKTTVDTLVTEIKREIDYDITDSNLDTLIIDKINDSLKRVKQLFLDHRLYDEITAQDTLTTTAAQEYIDISSETIDFDQHILLTERTNDRPIELVTFRDYRRSFPDPSADKSETPDIAAFFDNKLFLGPTPSTSSVTIYLDYIKLISDVASGGSSPFEDKYDEIIKSMVIEKMKFWLDDKNINAIAIAKANTKELVDRLIIGAAKNIGMNLQMQRRVSRVPFFAPRKVV